MHSGAAIVFIDLLEVVVSGTACSLEVDDDVAADELYVVGIRPIRAKAQQETMLLPFPGDGYAYLYTQGIALGW